MIVIAGGVKIVEADIDHANGDVVVVGHQTDMLLMRIKPDGTLDTSFQNGPRFTSIPLEPGLNLIDFHDISGATTERRDFANVVKRLDDGSYLVAGTTVVQPNVNDDYDGDYDFAVAKLQPDGSLDPTFGNSGRLTFNIQAGKYESVTDIALQADGKIVLLGQTVEAANNHFPDIAVIRLNPNGTFDPTFNGNGRAVINFDPGSDTEEPRSISIRPDGKIVIVGSTLQHDKGAGTSVAGFVLRLHSDGSRDATYGTNGVARFAPVNPSTADLRSQGLRVISAMVQPDGKILGVSRAYGSFFDEPSASVAFRVVADEGTGGGTTPPPRDVAPPRVLGVTLTTNRKTKTITGIVIRFSEGLNVTSALWLANYDLRTTARKAKPIRFRFAFYVSTTQSVTLVPAGKLAAKTARRLTVHNIADIALNLLDGDGNGSAGGSYVKVIRSSGR